MLAGVRNVCYLDMFHALWNLCSSERGYPSAPEEPAKERPVLSRKDALSRLPVGTKVVKPVGDVCAYGFPVARCSTEGIVRGSPVFCCVTVL